jgi:hypothetical protein
VLPETDPIVLFQQRNIFLKPLKCSQVLQRGKILNYIGLVLGAGLGMGGETGLR